MIRMIGYDARPDAMTIAEAVCVVCDKPCTAEGIVVQVEWGLDNERAAEWQASPLLAVHRGSCDDRLERAATATQGMTFWWDLPEFARFLANALDRPPVVGVEDESGTILLRRRARRINLRRTADLLDSL
jgi:hypothetical protein